MSGNPFKIHDEVDGDWEVERASTHVVDVEFDSYELEWREVEEGIEVLTLDEILHQVKKSRGRFELVPFIRVHYSMGLWGAIFEVGNYTELGGKWIVHGITKGYA